jgi:membrane protease subunit HflC
MALFNINFGGGREPRPDTVPDSDYQEAVKILRAGITRRVILFLIILIAWLLASQCVVITRPDQYVTVRQFGEVIRITQEPGLSFKMPFVQTVSSVPRDVQMYDMPISDVFTQDKKTMVADSFVLWRINDPIGFIRATGGSMGQAESILGSNSFNSLKNVISRLSQTEIISGRDTLAQHIFANLGDALNPYGVEMMAIETKHLDLPDDNKDAVYERMISERNNIAAQYTAEGDEEARMIRTETDKTVNILTSNAQAEAAETIADGESQYMEILAQAYDDTEKSEFYAFVRALDAAKVALSGGDNTLILGRDSPIAQIFYNN